MTQRTRARAAAPVVSLADKRQWSVQEFAALFGVSVPTIYRYARQGEIRLSKSAGRTFITREEAARWQAENAAFAESLRAVVGNDNATHGTAA